MLINSYFLINGVLQTGLSPVISIVNIDTDSLVVNGAAMTKSTAMQHLYYYDFAGYDQTVNYGITVDGGSSIIGNDRYQFLTCESVKETINDLENNLALVPGLVWEELKADHILDGTFGNELATTADVSASASTIYHIATSGTIIGGDLTSGTFEDTFVRDGTYWVIQENVTTGLTVEMSFQLSGADCKAGVIQVFGHYDGKGTPHYMELWIYNTETTAWELLHEQFMTSKTTDEDQRHEYYEQHIDRDDNNTVRIRLVHNITTYVDTHLLQIDNVLVSCIDIVTAEEIAAAVWDEGTSQHVVTGTFGKQLQILDTSIEFIKQMESGKWKIFNNQMIFYKDDNVTEIAKFNLFDRNGSPITPIESAVMRVRV